MLRFFLSALLVLSFTSSSLSQESQAQLGVYATHSTTAQCVRLENWSWDAAIIRRLDSIARTNVTCVWWTSLPDDEGLLKKYFLEHRLRGMSAIAGSGAWYISAGNYQTPGIVDTQFNNLKRLHDAIPASDRPLAWSLGDEPIPAALPNLKLLADRCKTAGIPTTLVNVPEYIGQTNTVVGNSTPSQCLDFYPFFVPGLSSNPPYGQAALTGVITQQLNHVQRSVAARIRPQFMTQGYSDLVLHTLPTSSQTEWQIWSSFMAGIRDNFVFIHGMPSNDGIVTPTPSLVDWRRDVEMLTPQGIAVQDVYRRLKPHTALLGRWALDSRPTITAANAGDCAAIYRDGTKRYLIVMADPDKPQRTMYLAMPHWTATSIAGGPVGFNWFGNFWITLPPGSGNIWEVR
jgi:hypothetical protein